MKEETGTKCIHVKYKIKTGLLPSFTKCRTLMCRTGNPTVKGSDEVGTVLIWDKDSLEFGTIVTPRFCAELQLLL